MNDDWDPYDELMKHRNQLQAMAHDILEIAQAHNRAQTMINDLLSQNSNLLRLITLQQQQIEILVRDTQWMESQIGIVKPF